MEWTFAAEVTEADHRSYQRHSFQVPAGVDSLRIAFQYGPVVIGEWGNLLCLSLFDPHGFRGAGHRGGSPQEVLVSPGKATPGYLAGRIGPGLWTVEVACHQVLAGPPCRYRLLARASRRDPGEVPSLTQPQSRESDSLPDEASPGWFRGDLHAHTDHSDAIWSRRELLARASDLNLDFVGITDHNTVSPHFAPDETDRSRPLLIPGMELTTFRGHALCLGSSQWIDWRTGGGRTLADVVEEVQSKDALFVIAHPSRVGNPVCTGCHWEYDDTHPGSVRHLEIWNGPWETEGARNRELWFRWLNRGLHVFATAGSDAHALVHYRPSMPVNCVHADTLRVESILEALAQGRHYLTTGPELVLRIQDGERPVGGALRDRLDGTAALRWSAGPAGSEVVWIVDGAPVASWSAEGQGDTCIPLRGDRFHWVIAEMRDHRGLPLAITNPLFAGAEQTS